MSIYSLPDEVICTLTAYENLFDSTTGELIGSEEELELIKTALDNLANKTNDTTEWYLKDRANKLAYIAWIQSEITRLTKIVEREQRNVARSENLIERIFSRIYEGSKTIIGSFTLVYTESKSCSIMNESLIPKEFLRIIPAVAETTAPDKNAIKASINDGKEVPGACIVVNKSFKIK